MQPFSRINDLNDHLILMGGLSVLLFAYVLICVLVLSSVYLPVPFALAAFGSFQIVMQQQVDVPLFSLHSSSKGLVGECGFRGGCVLIENVEDAVKQQLYKLSSMSLCSNLFGQLMMTNLCNPPRPGDPSYPSFIKEKESIYRTTRRKADTVYRHLNAVPGISCQRIEGSVFGFPRIELPKSEDQMPSHCSKGLTVQGSSTKI